MPKVKTVKIPSAKNHIYSSNRSSMFYYYMFVYGHTCIYVTNIMKENEAINLRGRHGKGSSESNWEGGNVQGK